MWVVILLFSLLWCVCVCVYLPHCHANLRTIFFPRIRSYLRMCMAWVDVFIFSFAIVAVAVSRCRPIQIRNIALVTLRIFTMCPLHVKARTFPCHTHTHTPNANHVSRALLCVVSLFFACKHNCLMPWKLRCVLEASFAVTLVESMSHSHSISARWWRH